MRTTPASLLVPTAASLVIALGAAAATAQSFQQGDLYLFSPAINGSSSTSGALVRLRPSDGTGAIVNTFFGTPQQFDAAAFDPYRNAMVFMAQLTLGSPVQLWQCDAAGNLTSLGYPNRVLASFAPANGGRIYLRDVQEFPAGRLHYLDASNQYHTVMDASGAVPFEFFPGSSTQFHCMHYHAPTNALFVAHSSGFTQVCGGGATSTTLIVRRVTLSADGARAVGPVLCAQFEVSTSGESAVALDEMSDGTLLAVVDSNTNAAEPRLVRLDPWTMATSTFATIGPYIGAAATNAGCWSSVVGGAVVIDTGNDVMRSFQQGQSGTGITIAFPVPVSSAGGSGEVASLVEVRGEPCAGAYVGYGDGLAGAGAFVPTLTATNCPIPGAVIDLHVASGLGGSVGVIGLGTSPAAIPLLGGTLLVMPVTLSTLLLDGAPWAAGEGHGTVPLLLPPNPALSGLSVYGQAAVFDPAAVEGFSLSPGLQIVIG